MEIKKIYWAILNMLPRKAALKANLALRCLFEDWDFAVNQYLFSADFADLENDEIRRRLDGLDESSIQRAEEYVRRCRNLERMKGYPFSDGSRVLLLGSALALTAAASAGRCIALCGWHRKPFVG